MLAEFAGNTTSRANAHKIGMESLTKLASAAFWRVSSACFRVAASALG